MGLTSALAMAGRSLEIFTAGIEVAGQNISNANTPGYIREQLEIRANSPSRVGNLVFGTGAQAVGITQQIDIYLEQRLYAANSDAASSSARESIYKQLEAQIRELGSEDLSTRLNEFLSSINEVVNTPENPALRLAAVQQGQRLASDIVALRTRVDEVRKAQVSNIDSLVKEANELIATINELNPKISRLEIGGFSENDAGALRTQRYNALNRLSEILPIRFQEGPTGIVDVFTGSEYLILGGQTQQLETTVSVDRNVNIQSVRLSKSKSDLSPSNGELAGVIEGRDTVLGGFVDELDLYTSTLISSFNRVHSSGEGLAGYDSLTTLTKVDAANLSLNDAGLAFTPTHGSFELKVVNKLTGLVTTTDIAIDLDGIGADTTLDSLRAAIDAVANVNSTVTTDRRLQITADNNFEIRFGPDSSGALAALGINTFFTGSTSADIGVNPSLTGKHPTRPELPGHSLFATSQGGGPSDGRNATALAQFLDTPQQTLGGIDLNSHYNTLIASVAQNSAAESAVRAGFEGYQESLLGQREQRSGVSLDEEAIHLIEFQRAYQSSARIISTVDELFNVLLSL